MKINEIKKCVMNDWLKYCNNNNTRTFLTGIADQIQADYNIAYKEAKELAYDIYEHLKRN